MGRFITTFIMVISLIFSPLQAISPVGVSLFASNMDKGTGESIQLPTIGQNQQVATETTTEETEPVDTNPYGVNSFITLDFEGYCTIEVPQSHFTKQESGSTATQYDLKYKDNKSRLTMSFVTNIGSDTDIPGYITREVAGVETTTNNKVEVTYGNNVSWMKVPAEEKIDGCNIYVYYTLNESKSSAFWCRVKVTPDSDTEEFNDVLRQIFDTYSTYGGTGTIFDTPDTGMYEDSEDPNEGDTTGYEANTLANQVFSGRGGYIPDADISANWEDLEIILDGVKFQLPCNLSDFYDANYEVNDKKVTANNMTVPAGRTLDVALQNDNGLVVIATFYNNSLKMDQAADDCPIMKIIVDSDKFINVTQAEKDKKQKEKEETSEMIESQIAEEEEAKKKAEEEEKKKAEEEANKQYVTTNTTVNIREKPNTDCEVLKKAEPGEKYEYIRMSDDGEWYCVKFEDKEAFIKSTYGDLGEKGAESSSEDTSTDESESTDTESTDSTKETEGEDTTETEPVETKKVVKLLQSAPLKEGPDSESRKILTLMRGDIYDYISVSEDGRWYEIDYFGVPHWVTSIKTELIEMGPEEYKEAQAMMRDKYFIDEEEEEQEALEKAANMTEDTAEEVDYTSEEYDDSYDEYGHQVILPGGVTWTAYVDDIVAYYGTGVSKSKYNNGEQLRLQWTRGEKYMTIITGTIKQIYSVEMSCVPTN